MVEREATRFVPGIVAVSLGLVVCFLAISDSNDYLDGAWVTAAEIAGFVVGGGLLVLLGYLIARARR
ncbi:hypothetical protein FAIPA1_410047 [Frankia sp. AiPs1]|nr:hypothetical protein [Frankia sp. AiPa1]